MTDLTSFVISTFVCLTPIYVLLPDGTGGSISNFLNNIFTLYLDFQSCLPFSYRLHMMIVEAGGLYGTIGILMLELV